MDDVIVNIERTYTPDRRSDSIDHSNNNYEAVDLFGLRSRREKRERERGGRGISRRFRTKTIKFRARIRKMVKRETRDGAKDRKIGRREEKKKRGMKRRAGG